MSDEGVPFPEEKSLSYYQCFKKFSNRNAHWKSVEMLKLLFTLRLICSILCGLVLGLLRVRALFAEITFVVVSTSAIPRFVSLSLGFNIFCLFDTPAVAINGRTVVVYLVFTAAWMLGTFLSHTVIRGMH